MEHCTHGLTPPTENKLKRILELYHIMKSLLFILDFYGIEIFNFSLVEFINLVYHNSISTLAKLQYTPPPKHYYGTIW